MQLQTDQIPDERILQLYTLIEFKGKGAYGIVWKAIDKQTKKVLALKKVFDAFSNNTDAQRTYREVIFLKQLQDHENIVKLYRIHRASNMKDLYMTFEYMETDLHKVIRANILHQQHITYILYQLLKAIKYLHSGNLLHRDLKPSNLLVDEECKVKIADFGLARSINSQDETPILTEYVATRWYRAPEILLGSHTYTKAVDMWSVGLILAEMITKKSLFTGTSTVNQIEKIIELLGKPTPDDIINLQCPLADQIFDHLTTKKRTTYVQQFQGASELQIDFVRKCLTWNPSRRMSVEQALSHQLIDDYRGSEAEKILVKDLLIPFKENQKQDVKSYRECLYSMDKDFVQMSKIRVKTLPESRLSNEAIPQQIKKPSPCHNRYFSQNKIQAPLTPLRSKSFHNPISNNNNNNNNNVFQYQNNNNNNNNNNHNNSKNLNPNINIIPNPNGYMPQNQIQSVQKILQTYLKPKHNFTVKKRSRVIVEQSVLKKNLAKNYFDAGSMITFQK